TVPLVLRAKLGGCLQMNPSRLDEARCHAMGRAGISQQLTAPNNTQLAIPRRRMSAGANDTGRTLRRAYNKTKRKQQCLIAPKVLGMAKSRDVQSVMASLVSSGTTRGEPRFVPGSALIASELAGKATAIGCPGSKSP